MWVFLPSKHKTKGRPFLETLVYLCEQEAGGLWPPLQQAWGRAMIGDTSPLDSQITSSLLCTICASPSAAEIQVAEYQFHVN